MISIITTVIIPMTKQIQKQLQHSTTINNVQYVASVIWYDARLKLKAKQAGVRKTIFNDTNKIIWKDDRVDYNIVMPS